MSTASKINGISVASITAINGVDIGDVASILGVDITSAPPIPPFTDIAAAWWLNNFDPVGYVGSHCLNVTEDNGAGSVRSAGFVSTSPYAIDPAGASLTTPPYLTNTFFDQTGLGNDLAATTTKRPTYDATNQLLSFNGTSNGMQGASALYPTTQTGTIYGLFKAGSLIETSIIVETDTGAANRTVYIRISMVAGVFTFSVYDDTAITALPNTKIKTISDNNWHLFAATFDTTNGTPANQTGLKIDNSTSGVTSPLSTDLHDLEIGNALPNVGARNNAASLFFTGSMRGLLAKSVVDDATTQTAMYEYVIYLQSVSP